MAKRDARRSGGRPRKKREKTVRRETPEVEEARSGGLLTGLRGGMKKVTGAGPTKKVERPSKRVIDALLWAAVIAALVFYLLRRWR